MIKVRHLIHAFACALPVACTLAGDAAQLRDPHPGDPADGAVAAPRHDAGQMVGDTDDGDPSRAPGDDTGQRGDSDMDASTDDDGGRGDDVGATPPVVATIDAQGGTLSLGALTLHVPAGALDTATEISIEVHDDVPAVLASTLRGPGPVYRLGPEGTRFGRDVEIRLYAPAADDEIGVLWTRDGALELALTRREGDYLIATADHFSWVWAITWRDVPAITWNAAKRVVQIAGAAAEILGATLEVIGGAEVALFCAATGSGDLDEPPCSGPRLPDGRYAPSCLGPALAEHGLTLHYNPSTGRCESIECIRCADSCIAGWCMPTPNCDTDLDGVADTACDPHSETCMRTGDSAGGYAQECVPAGSTACTVTSGEAMDWVWLMGGARTYRSSSGIVGGGPMNEVTAYCGPGTLCANSVMIDLQPAVVQQMGRRIVGMIECVSSPPRLCDYNGDGYGRQCAGNQSCGADRWTWHDICEPSQGLYVGPTVICSEGDIAWTCLGGSCSGGTYGCGAGTLIPNYN